MKLFAVLAYIFALALTSGPVWAAPNATKFIWVGGQPSIVVQIACQKKKCENCQRNLGPNSGRCAQWCAGC